MIELDGTCLMAEVVSNKYFGTVLLLSLLSILTLVSCVVASIYGS